MASVSLDLYLHLLKGRKSVSHRCVLPKSRLDTLDSSGCDRRSSLRNCQVTSAFPFTSQTQLLFCHFELFINVPNETIFRHCPVTVHRSHLITRSSVQTLCLPTERYCGTSSSILDIENQPLATCNSSETEKMLLRRAPLT